MNALRMLSYAIKPPVPWIERAKDSEIATWIEDDIAYIAFQGSLSLTDWIYNFMAYSIFGIHAGMWKKYKILYNDFNDFIFKNLGRKIVFLGHSQGAGIALIAYVELKRRLRLKTEAYLFGCPKVLSLWRCFATYGDCKEVYQFKVLTDIVTYLSPMNGQVGRTIKLGMKLPIWKWKIKDHYPSSYKKWIKELGE